MSETIYDKVIQELKYGMNIDGEQDIAFVGVWVSRKGNGDLTPTWLQLTDSDVTDDLREKIVKGLHNLADSVELEINNDFPDPRLLTTDAPEMTVGDSSSVSQQNLNNSDWEAVQMVSVVCPRCELSWSEPVLPPVLTDNTCPVCDGKGWIGKDIWNSEQCLECDGSGKYLHP